MACGPVVRQFVDHAELMKRLAARVAGCVMSFTRLPPVGVDDALKAVARGK